MTGINIFLFILIWLLAGWLFEKPIYECFGSDLNPLWKIPLSFLGPINVLILLVVAIYFVVKDYIQEIKDYYIRKR